MEEPMRMIIKSRITVFLCVMMLLTLFPVLMIGCATVPEQNPALESARAAYEEAKANPEIAKKAPVAMYEAEQAFKKAELAEEVDKIDHLAYLAEKKSQIAVLKAEQVSAEQERERLSEEKERIVLQARELETKKSISLAESRALQAEKARQEAEAKSREIEQAKRDVEAKALEAEKARKEAEAKALEAQLAQLELEKVMAERKKIESELAELKAKQTDRGLVLTLGDILFEVGKDRLLPGAMVTIDKLSEFLTKYLKKTILIEGHTDSTGSDLYNLGLSQRRAESVRDALLLRGIKAERIITKGYGEQYPIASNANSAGRQENRRVEVVILDEDVKPDTMMR